MWHVVIGYINGLFRLVNMQWLLYVNRTHRKYILKSSVHILKKIFTHYGKWYYLFIYLNKKNKEKPKVNYNNWSDWLTYEQKGKYVIIIEIINRFWGFTIWTSQNRTYTLQKCKSKLISAQLFRLFFWVITDILVKYYCDE